MAHGSEVLMAKFGEIQAFAEQVAAELGLDLKVDDCYTERPLRQDKWDPQISLNFIKGKDRVYNILVVAYAERAGLRFIADGDLELGDGEGFEARQLWHAAVVEEFAVKIAKEWPTQAAHLRCIALDLHTPRTEDFTSLFAAQ